MGQASWNQERADTELRSLFAGQWRNGLLPHIVFAERRALLPGTGVLAVGAKRRTRPECLGRPASSSRPSTRRLCSRSTGVGPTVARARALLDDLQPKLAAWHEYLYRERTREGSELVEIWHPWESGMDNSPLWDEALDADLAHAPSEIPEYRRVDVELADAAERPTDDEYDRYVYLVGLYRELDYDPDRDP